MSVPFDVFEILPDGQVLWHSAAATLNEAQTVAQQLAIRSQNCFFVLNQSTRQKFLVTVPAAKTDTTPHQQSVG